MTLVWLAQLRRLSHTRTPLGSEGGVYVLLAPVLSCDVAPLTDAVALGQFGSQELLTHLIHFQPGTDVRVRDEAVIVAAPNNVGRVGDTYLITEVLNPSEELAFVKCRAIKGKQPEK